MGVIKGSFQKHLKTGGGVKAKVLRRGRGGFEGGTTMPPENFKLRFTFIANLSCINYRQYERR